jgi:hypothetical protein
MMSIRDIDGLHADFWEECHPGCPSVLKVDALALTSGFPRTADKQICKHTSPCHVAMFCSCVI